MDYSWGAYTVLGLDVPLLVGLLELGGQTQLLTAPEWKFHSSAQTAVKQ